jgi:aminoglycoside phosphotransferase (APT) family kinase protein
VGADAAGGLAGLVDLASLEEWMDSHGLGSGPLERVERLTGGTQNILVRFVRDGVAYVLRRPPRHLRPASNANLLREARVLRALTGQGVAAPALIAACADESVLGAAFFLMQPIDGFNASTELPPLHAGDADMRHRMGLSAIEGIAAVAALGFESLGLGDFGRPEGFLQRQVPRWLRELDSYTALDGYSLSSYPDITHLTAWLENAIPAAYEPGIVHGDFHAANLLFARDSAELAAILDWEMATVGDPLLDLGWFLATWPFESTSNIAAAAQALASAGGLATRAELIEHYARHSSRRLDAIDWYAVLACFKLSIVLEGTYARACAGKADRNIGDALHTIACALVEQAEQFMSGGVR